MVGQHPGPRVFRWLYSRDGQDAASEILGRLFVARLSAALDLYEIVVAKLWQTPVSLLRLKAKVVVMFPNPISLLASFLTPASFTPTFPECTQQRIHIHMSIPRMSISTPLTSQVKATSVQHKSGFSECKQGSRGPSVEGIAVSSKRWGMLHTYVLLIYIIHCPEFRAQTYGRASSLASKETLDEVNDCSKEAES